MSIPSSRTEPHPASATPKSYLTRPMITAVASKKPWNPQLTCDGGDDRSQKISHTFSNYFHPSTHCHASSLAFHIAPTPWPNSQPHPLTAIDNGKPWILWPYYYSKTFQIDVGCCRYRDPNCGGACIALEVLASQTRSTKVINQCKFSSDSFGRAPGLPNLKGKCSVGQRS